MQQRKVAIIGDGAVGSSVAYTLLLGHAVNEIVIVDTNADKAEGDALDMLDGNSFLGVPKIVRSGTYEDVMGSHIVVVTAGAAQKVGETRMDLLRKNAAITKSICASLKPVLEEGSIVMFVSNPVDVLTYIGYKELGISANRVIGSGTVLDTSRLKVAISQDTGIDPRSIHTFVVGEHGDSEVPLWSATSVGGLNLLDYCDRCGRCAGKNMTRLNDLHEKVRSAAYRIIEKKGATNYAVALAVKRIVSSILNDENSVLTVSTLCTDEASRFGDVYMSLPCVVGRNGIERVLSPNYSVDEEKALAESARTLREKLSSIGY